MHWNGHMNGGGWGYGLMAASMVLFWALLVFGIVVLVRYLSRTGRPSTPQQSRITPEQLLAERFARGEIGTDEYRERLEVLRSSGHSPSHGSDRPGSTGRPPENTS